MRNDGAVAEVQHRPRGRIVAERSIENPPFPPAIAIWAVIGSLLLVVELFFVARWITSPYFTAIPVGPDRAPTWMSATIAVGQIVLTVLGVGFLYFWVVRPWRRERRTTTMGLICVATLAFSPYDGISGAIQHWFGYNAHLFNRGSVLSVLPGVVSYNEPGAGQSWPFAAMPIYVVGFAVLGWVGQHILRAAHRRFPRCNAIGLLAVCVVCMAVVDMVLEGLVFLPLGWWTYAGGHFPVLNGGTYYQLPLNEVLHTALLFTVPGALLFFVDDRGNTVAERGVEKLRQTGLVRTAVVRGLAVLAVVHLAFLATYHLPQTFWGAASARWPDSVARRSYLNDGICGPVANRACPGPGVPNARPGSGYVNFDGEFVPLKKP